MEGDGAVTTRPNVGWSVLVALDFLGDAVVNRSYSIIDRSDDLNSLGYLGFGGGGFGTPVVSYAPLPMLGCWTSLVIILNI